MSIYHPIIVIDEDHDDLRLLSDAHQDLKLTDPLIFFRECEQVIPYLQSESIAPKLIISDYRFRRMNGPQLKRQMLTSSSVSLRQIPFVIWSSVMDPIDRAEIEELEIQALMLKPTTYVELLLTYDRIVKTWGRVYQTTHCANTMHARLPMPSNQHPINVFSACAHLI